MAGIERIKVSTEELQSAATSLSTELKTVEECFSNMKQTMEASSYYWVGSAGDAHRQLYTKQVATIENVLRRYHEHITDLADIAGIYIEGERKVTNQTEELPISILGS